MIKQSFLKNCGSFLIILALILSILPFKVSAQQSQTVVPQKPIIIKILGENLNQGILTATIELTNPNQINYRDVYYTTRLQGADIAKSTTINGKQTTEFTQGPLLDYSTSEKFDLGPGQVMNFPLKVSYSTAIISNTYKFQLSVFADGDVLIGGFAKDLALNGSGNFLNIGKCVLVVNKVEYDPIIGPNVAPKEAPVAKCIISNPSTTSLTVFSQAEYAVNSVADKKGNQVFSDKTPITISAKSSKSVNLALPALETPQVYESLSYLQDSQGNIVSPRIAFRWIVGGESSLIRSITLDKSEYQKGDTAKVTVGADPSMDLYWRGGGPVSHFGLSSASSSAFVTPELQGTPLTDAAIAVSIKDGSGQLCGQSEQKMSTDPNQNIWPDQVLSVAVDKKCTNPTVTAKVLNNGKELASKEIKVSVPVVAGDSYSSSKKALWWVSGVLLLLIGIAGFIFYKWRQKNRQKSDPPSTPPSPGSSKTVITPMAAAIIGILITGFMLIDLKMVGLPALSLVKTVSAVEIGPGSAVSVHYEGIRAFRRGQPCPGPVWKADNPQPQGDDGQGGCLIAIVSAPDETNFTFLDTQDQIVFENNGFKVPVSGQFKGYGCGNSKIGLIVRAFVNGSSEGVKINGGTNRAVFSNLGSNGGGSGTNFTQNLVITPGEANVCGPQNVKIELIPFIEHVGLVASDKAEDKLFTDAEIPGWNDVTYYNRKSCGTTESCYGVLQKNNIPTVSCLACNQSCQSTDQCLGMTSGCVECRPNEAGENVCQPPPLACNATCSDSKDCFGNKEGCNSCEPNAAGTGKVCAKPPVCGSGCVRDDQCAGAVKDGCTVCLPSSTGTGKVCSKPPACGTSCTRDDQCSGAVKDGCTVCESTTPGGPKTCVEPFDEAACKCDGFNAINISNPSQGNFKFEAFGKVEGKDVTKAKIDTMTFSLYKSSKSNPNSSTKIATSNAITPTIVASESGKIRYRAEWSVAPPAYDANAIYRVGADPKCVRAKGPVTAAFDFSGAIYNSDNSQVEGQLNYTPARLAQANDNLELGTLKDGYYTRVVDTDSCKFIRFEYGQY